jgi:hypothetical protein
MRLTQHTLRRLFNSRAFTSRRGSMLIMVIVILVLLALIGTAMISTSRIDRVSTAQHSINVQVELLLDSAKRMVSGELVQDLFGPSGTVYKAHPLLNVYRPQDSAQEDRFLAPRAPEVVDQLADATPVSNEVYWPSITYPLLGSAPGTATFEAPGRIPVTLTAAKREYRFIPTTGSFAGNPNWPMIQAWWYNPATPGWEQVPNSPFPGADTDGDGIADAGLFKLPVGELNGVSYYVAVRIIDHGSAVNLSTAWKINDDAINVGTPDFQVPGDFFPSNINLMTFLANAASPQTAAEQIIELNKYRFDDNVNATPVANLVPVADGGANRADFRYISGYDAFWNQLGRRLGNPGLNQQTPPDNFYKALSESDGAALAYPFGIYSSSFGASTPGTRMPLSLETNVASTKFTGATAPYDWYNKNFNFVRKFQAGQRNQVNVRALSVTRNGVSDVAPVFNLIGALGANNDDGYLTSTPLVNKDKIPFYNRAANEIVPKTSVNTAQFNYLWRAFYNVMAATPNTPPYIHAGTMTNPVPTVDGRMFRPVLRNPLNPEEDLTDPTTGQPTITSFEVMMLRAAIAAVNTIDLRDGDYHVTSRKVVIRNSANVANAKYEATVFGAEPQPFITEVFAQTDNVTAYAGGPNPKGYVAVELYNPYPFAISLSNWQLGILTRQNSTATAPAPANPYPGMRLTTLSTFPGFPAPGGGRTGAHIIEPGQHVVLENYPGDSPRLDPNDAFSRPPEIGTIANPIYVSGLHEVIRDATATDVDGTELVLLRPRRAILTGGVNNGLLENDQLCRSTDPADPMGTFDEGQPATPNLYDMIPVDSFDFAGMAQMGTAPDFMALHYIRPTDAWKFVYPGKYTASATERRQEGTLMVRWNPTTDPFPPTGPPYIFNPWDPPDPAPQTIAPGDIKPAISLGAANGYGRYLNDYPGIQWANVDQAGPRATDAAPYRFPFGGFARNGDMLHIPFVGAYTLRQTAGDAAGTVTDRTLILEMNSVSMDAQAAEDGDNANNAYENIGRFTPLSAANPTTSVANDYYAWAYDLFDFLTVMAPSDDYLPDVDPGAQQAVTLANGDLVTDRRYPAVPTSPAPPPPVAVKNSTSAAAHDNRTATGANAEALLTTQGKININTASYYVLGQVPWVPNTATNTPRDVLSIAVDGTITDVANGVPDNIDIARLIVAYRDGNPAWGFNTPAGPFRTIFDLNRIVAATDNNRTFQRVFRDTPPAGDFDDADGDLSPLGAGTDGVRNDYEEQFMMLNRVSNLITTRSDVFTCYLTLLGFRNANGPGAPELAVQRRAVMILDRSGVTSVADTPRTMNVPTE